MALSHQIPRLTGESGENIGFKVQVAGPAGEEGSTMRIIFPGGFHLMQHIKIPVDIDMTQQGKD